MLCQATLESVVRERFGSKPLRLFRLLLTKRLLEQKQLTDMALIPNKESKEMLYSLLAENFVSLQVGVVYGRVLNWLSSDFLELCELGVA